MFTRDDYTCRVCGGRGGRLHAHHLDGYHWCAEKRWDTDNGATLCTACHRNFHAQFGYRNNTREQYESFISSVNV